MAFPVVTASGVIRNGRLVLHDRKAFEFKDFSSVDLSEDTVGGGPQRLFLMLVGRMSPAGHISLEDEEAVKVHRYAYAYGNGGYQKAFRAVVKALWRAGWVQTEKEQHKEQPEHKGRRWAGER